MKLQKMLKYGWLKFALLASLMAGNILAASITYSLTTVGTDGSGDTVYRYVYDLSGIELAADQELDIRFDVSQYKQLLNGVAPAGFDLQLFQPDAPPGADGAYSLLALVNQPSMLGTFSVDFTLLGGGAPGAQQYFVNQYGANGTFLNTVASGSTDTPEPVTAWLGLSGLLAAGLLRAARR